MADVIKPSRAADSPGLRKQTGALKSGADPLEEIISFENDGGGFDYEIDGDELLASLAGGFDIPNYQRPDQKPEGPSEEEHRLQQRIDELEAQNKHLQHRVERLQAEFERARARFDRDQEQIRQNLQSDLMLQVLPLMDNFERAIGHATSEEVNEDFITGVILLYKQLSDLLEQNRVIPINATGETFDPQLHEAVLTEPHPNYESNTVIAEFEKGYTIGTRLLRPARVKVAVKSKAEG